MREPRVWLSTRRPDPSDGSEDSLWRRVFNVLLGPFGLGLRFDGELDAADDLT